MHFHEIQKLSDDKLLQGTQSLVLEERRITLLVLRHLREIERRRLFADRGYGSLFDYCTRELKYSEAAAQRRIASMRLLRELPEIETRIEEGRLSLSVVSRAQTFFRQESRVDTPVSTAQKREILQELEGKSAREAERVLLARSSDPVRLLPERVRAVSAEISEVRFVADQKFLSEVEVLRGLLAHSHPDASMAELLEFAVALAVKKLDRAREPERKSSCSKRAPVSSDLPPVSVQVSPPVSPLPTSEVEPGESSEEGHGTAACVTPNRSAETWRRARSLPRALEREVWRRDASCCSYTDSATGRKCGSRHRLQVDHVRPWALGGETTLENLRLLCFRHNQRLGIKSFGFRRMRRL